MGSGFVLNEKGELYADVETSYGTSPAATSLGTSDVANLKTFKTRVMPIKVPVEDEGGGMIPGVAGQELLKVGESVEYSGSILLREFTVPGTDTTRPNTDIWLRAGGFLAGVHSTSPSAITYNMSLANNGESVVYSYREWGDDTTRKVHNVAGGRHSLMLKFVAGQGIVLEINDGKAVSYDSPTNIAAQTAPDSMTFHGAESVIPYLSATTALLQIGGSTYGGKIREVNIGLIQRTEMLPDGDSATGFSEAFSNPIKPTFDMLVYERNTALEIRDAWNTAEAHFDLDLTTAGPTTSGNTLNVRVQFDIESLSEEAGPAGIKAIRITGKLLFGSTSAPGRDPSVPPIVLTYTS